MIAGTRNVILPKNPHLLSIFLNASIGLLCVFLPIAISVVRSVNPNVNTNIK